jgi:hypothetical protein
MSCIAAITYDPAVQVLKSTAALLAMTVLDTTNLRITFTVPANGRVLVRLAAAVSGSTSAPSIYLGVFEGGTLKGRRLASHMAGGAITSTSNYATEAYFIVTGLTPGASLTWDAAYGVEVNTALTNLKYGGPDDAVSNNADGPFCFEVWTA